MAKSWCVAATVVLILSAAVGAYLLARPKDPLEVKARFRYALEASSDRWRDIEWEKYDQKKETFRVRAVRESERGVYRFRVDEYSGLITVVITRPNENSDLVALYNSYDKRLDYKGYDSDEKPLLLLCCQDIVRAYSKAK